MDINLLREIVTVMSFTGFVGIVVYAVHPRNRTRFEEAGRLPFDDEPSPKGEGANVGRGFTKSEHR